MTTGRPTQVLVAVGTDVHPFDRLMDWLEQWYAGCPEPPTLVVQYGHSRRPGLPGAVDFLGHGELTTEIGRSTTVVCHGGPATITEIRRAGLLPIVVPRDPARGEHVDDHQQQFTRRLATAGMVRRCDREGELVEALTDGLADPDRFRLTADTDDRAAVARAVDRVGRIVEELIGPAGPGRRKPGRRGRSGRVSGGRP